MVKEGHCAAQPVALHNKMLPARVLVQGLLCVVISRDERSCRPKINPKGWVVAHSRRSRSGFFAGGSTRAGTSKLRNNLPIGSGR